MDAPIASQFTEDVIATRVSTCERLKCGKMIKIGEPRHFIGNQDHTLPGKFVCGGCYEYYKRSSSTTLRRPGRKFERFDSGPHAFTDRYKYL